MNDLTKATYIVCSCVGNTLMLAAAIAIPVWITPGHYGWTAFLVFCVLGEGYTFGKRMDLWTGKP